MKKLLTILLALAMILSMTACGLTNEPEQPAAAPTEAPAEAPAETPAEEAPAAE